MVDGRPASLLLISGCRAGTTLQYRVLQKKEQLELRGVHTDLRHGLAGYGEILEQLPSHDWLYLYRLAYGPLVERMINRARALSIPVIFDVDDLVFAPEVVHKVDPVKKMSLADAALYYEGVWRYRQALQASDFVVTSTQYLADVVRDMGQEAFVHRNGIGGSMISEADALRKPRAESTPDRVIMGYGSGTDTHRMDLAEITSALATVLTRHANVELHIVGPMEVPAALTRFEGRVRRLPLVPWREWLSVLNTFDINLAPLESGNPFCEGKSEIKYTEAAILEIPTVASRIRAYETAIRDGETGFLADRTDVWVSKLETLVADTDLRRELGRAARSDVLARYSPKVMGQRLVETLSAVRALYEQRRAPAIEEEGDPAMAPLILNWVFPEPIPGSGGHTDIIRMINLLSSFGHHNNAYVVPGIDLRDKSELEIRESIEEQFGRLEASVFKWKGGPMLDSDGVILTHWTTAYMLREADTAGKIFYFVQDWEPFFFPMGTEYLRAEQTYKMGFSCITLGPWLTERLTDWYDADADYFDFAVDHDIYYPRSVDKPEKPRICFYARPSTPRRLFPMGMEALELVHSSRPDVEIVFYGVNDDELRRQRIPFPYSNRGILTEEELAELFSSCHLGIVLSPTNCSLVPPEMMACRCAVVDLNRETVRGVLEHTTNAMLAESTPEGIAEAVLELLEDNVLREHLIETAYQQVQQRSWTKSARTVESILYKKLPSSRRALDRRQFQTPPRAPARADLPRAQRELLDAIHERRGSRVARWGARMRQWAESLAGGDRGTLLNRKPAHRVGELIRGRSVGQSFVARRDNLYRVDLLMSTYDRRNTRDVILHLRESPEAHLDLATVRINASLLVDNAYAHFIFEPQPDSAGKSYYVCVESPESVPGDAATLWAYSRVDLTSVQRFENHQVSTGQLIFGLFYRDERLGNVGERPLLEGWTRTRTLLWERLTKAYRLLTARDFGGLFREGLSYWKWIARRP